MEEKTVLIIGSGPAGLSASIYIARGGHHPLVIAGSQPGGQLMLTSEVENYPGYSQPVMGPDLMGEMRRQAERLGAEIIDEDATQVDFSSKPFKVWIGERVFQGDAVIIATGASPKWLGTESEKRLRGRGVSACATCDGFFFKDEEVVVVGGGDSAMEEAIFMTKFAKKITVIHRRDELRTAHILQQRAFANPKIHFLWSSVVEEFLGSERLEAVRVKNIKTGEVSTISCQGAFIAIGHKPNTEPFAGKVDLDPEGYIIRRNETKTNVEGVFAAGDAYDYTYRQAVTAAGSGCKAAIDAIRYLDAFEKII